MYLNDSSPYKLSFQHILVLPVMLFSVGLTFPSILVSTAKFFQLLDRFLLLLVLSVYIPTLSSTTCLYLFVLHGISDSTLKFYLFSSFSNRKFLSLVSDPFVESFASCCGPEHSLCFLFFLYLPQLVDQSLTYSISV